MTDYYALEPDPAVAAQRVAFGTSGHRGTSLECSFNEEHILAITQAICLYRRQNGIDGPLFLGIDTHALSESAFASALEVLAANGVEVMIDDRDGYTPTPVVSHAILTYNRGKTSGLADGIVVTPSHNPPEDGGFKYDPPNGGPADASITGWIQDRANAFLADGLKGVRRIPFEKAKSAATTHRHDYRNKYIGDLATVIDFDAIRAANLKLGVDPLGGAGVRYWPMIAERYGIPLTVVSDVVDPTFRFMTVDWDGKIRMDCSSPYAMQRLIALRGSLRRRVGVRHRSRSPRHRREERRTAESESLPRGGDLVPLHAPPRLAGDGRRRKDGRQQQHDRPRDRAPRPHAQGGARWFQVVRRRTGERLTRIRRRGERGRVVPAAGWERVDDRQGWNHHGIARGGDDGGDGEGSGRAVPGSHAEFGDPVYERIDAPATPEQKKILASLSPNDVKETELAGEKIVSMLTTAPGTTDSIGGLKVVAKNGWFAARPSGTEDIYKLYAESFLGADHLKRIQEEGQGILARAFLGKG